MNENLIHAFISHDLCQQPVSKVPYLLNFQQAWGSVLVVVGTTTGSGRLGWVCSPTVFLRGLKHLFGKSLPRHTTIRIRTLKHSSHGASYNFFILGTVLQHHSHATEKIATLRFAQRRKIALKIFLGGCRLSRLFQSPDNDSIKFYLIIHSENF
jgi:hypothetical protein